LSTTGAKSPARAKIELLDYFIAKRSSAA